MSAFSVLARLTGLAVAHHRDHPGRLLTSVLGIALGVGLGLAVHLVNRAAVNEFTLAVRNVAGEADLQAWGGRAGFPESTFAEIARLPQVAVASPVIEADVAVAGREEPLKVLGIDPFRALVIQPGLLGAATGEAFKVLEPDAVVLSASASAWLRAREGDVVEIVVGLERVPMHVVSVLPEDALRGRVALTDVGTAQWRLARLGSLNRIDLRLRPGVDVETARRSIAGRLPPGTSLEPPQARAETSANLSRSYRVNLNVLALVALFTGGFLVFSTQALEATRRRTEHALLRVLGLTRRGLLALVLAEGVVLGILGSALGVALAYLLAWGALTFVGADLGAGHFRGVKPDLQPAPIAAMVFFLIGIAVAVVGSFLPALDAAQSAPAPALKAGDQERAFARVRKVWPGVALATAGAGAAFAPPVAGIPVFGYASIALLLIGAVLLMPRLASFIFERLDGNRAVPVELALAQLRGAPGQAAVSLAAIVASFSLMVAMAIMVASFRQSVADWLDSVLPADLYFRTPLGSDSVSLAPQDEARLAELPGIARAEFTRNLRVILDPARPPVVVLARPLRAADLSRTLPLVRDVGTLQEGTPPPAWVSEAVADIYRLDLGSAFELPLAGSRAKFRVAGIWRDYARMHGAIVIERETYIGITGDRSANDVAMWLVPGTSVAAVKEAIRALPGGDVLQIADPGEIRAVSLKVFDRSFAVTYALEAVAVLVGLFGLSSSLGAIVLARRREFGMLRHVGMTRRQIVAMLCAEGTLLAVLGAVAGLALGWVISLVLIHVVNRQSFHWGMEMHLPWLFLLALTLLLVALAALTAYVSGREAMSVGAVRAVREDW
ncbi:MAG: FtsX-like permease family protein [Burkholderiales bacterium]